MTLVLWTVIALGAGLVATAVGMRGVRNALRGPERGTQEEKMPLTPLQKRAWWALGVGVGVTGAILAIFVVSGPSRVQDDPALRVSVEILLVAGLIAYGLLMMYGLLRTDQSRVMIDERDKAILERAPAVQALAMVVSVAAWSIILTEAYWEAGQVPVAFLTLIFWSCLLVSTMALPVGVLIGYRRS